MPAVVLHASLGGVWGLEDKEMLETRLRPLKTRLWRNVWEVGIFRIFPPGLVPNPLRAEKTVRKYRFGAVSAHALGGNLALSVVSIAGQE